MTARELIAKLEALSEEEKELEVCCILEGFVEPVDRILFHKALTPPMNYRTSFLEIL